MKIKAIMVAMLAIVFGMSLTACSDDDDEKSKSLQIDHVKLVTKLKLSQDLTDYFYVRINGTVLEGDGFTKTYQHDFTTTQEETLEIPLYKAPGKIEEYIEARDKVLDRPTTLKDNYHFAYYLTYTLVEVMKDGKEYAIDNDIYDGVKISYSINLQSAEDHKINEADVDGAILEIQKAMLENRNKRFNVEIIRTADDKSDEVKITKLN